MGNVYVYIDETGNHRQDAEFIVSVVIIRSGLESLQRQLEAVETESNKKRKWQGSKPKQRVAYIQGLMQTDLLQGFVVCSVYPRHKNEIEQKALAIAEALTAAQIQIVDQKIIIRIDGEVKRRVENQLKQAIKRQNNSIQINKIRGVAKGANDAVSRSADAFCGLVRHRNKPYIASTYRKAIKHQLINVVEYKKGA